MKFTLIVACLLMMPCGLCLADNPTPSPGGPPESVFSKPQPSLPEVDFDGRQLEDVIKLLQKVDGSFQAVIRSSNGGDENPFVTLHLKDVTIDQVMQVLCKKYGWGMDEVSQPGKPPIYVIAVRDQKQPDGKVSAYCVTPIVDDLVSRKNFDEDAVAVLSGGTPATKSADEKRKLRAAMLTEVVTTVETAMKMVANQPQPATIQVHEPTEMIIIKASPAQRDAAEEVLRALDEGKTRVVQKDSSDVSEQLRKMMEDKLQGASKTSALPNGPSLSLPGRADQTETDIRSRLELRRQEEANEEKEIKQLQREIEEIVKMREHAATQPAAPANK